MRELIIQFGKYQGKKWSDVPKTYLEYLGNNGSGELSELCIEELERRKSSVKKIHITYPAIDSASFALNDEWQNSVASGEFNKGFYSYLLAYTLHVLETAESDNQGNAYYKDLIFKFEFGKIYPTLLSVTRMKSTLN